ncbi:MAG: histidine--tRNA ligase [Bacteroidetes bacterium]|nr:MAG: histidine--tRNA ligase [Bacteroidota bacterium]
MATTPSIPRGTRDFLPEVMMRRERIFDTIRAVFRKYGYAPIETPAMENLQVLTGKYGEEGDRLIFKILNNGDFLKGVDPTLWEDPARLAPEISKRALRYDLTVPFARFVVQHQHAITFPFKRYQIQPVWRADNPQRGRYREFYQCDADVVGSDSLLFEAEFVAIFDEVLSTLGLPGFSILLNNRKILTGYAEAIGQADRFTDLCVGIDKLDKKPPQAVQAELEGRGIPTPAISQLFELIQFEGEVQAKLDFLEARFEGSETGRQGVAEMREVIDTLSHFPLQRATVDFNLQLARGLDYYTGTIFEVKAHDVKIGSICGGGRYADLTGVFGKPGLPGVGISFGADRIYDVMEELGLFEDQAQSSTQVLLIHFGAETYGPTLDLLRQLRSAGIAAELYPDAVKLKKQFAYADKKGIPFTLAAGTQEHTAQAYQLKDMATGQQETLSLEAIIERIRG